MDADDAMDAESSGTSGRGRRGWRSLAKRDWLAFDRADFVGTKIILSLAVVGIVLFGLLVPMVDALNVIALIVGLGGTLAQVVQGIADNQIQASGRISDPGPGTLAFQMSFTLIPLVMMLLIALIGEAFRRGVQLRSDVEGLV